MTVKFKEALIKTAEALLEAKGMVDDVKALNELTEIKNIFRSYENGAKLDISYLQSLDFRLRNDYPICEAIDNYHPTATVYNAMPHINQQPVPEEIRRLNVDRYGILYTTLYKKGRVRCIEDFIENVQ